MQTIFLWILALYGCASAWVHIQKSIYTPKRSEALRCYILTDHSQTQIEWVIRSMIHFGKLEGIELNIFLIDSDSNDDTLRIVERFVRRGVYIHLLDEPEGMVCHRDREPIVIDLRKGEYTCVLRTT